MLNNRPSLEQLQDRIYNNILSHLPVGEDPKRQSLLNILAQVQTGAFHSLYEMLDFYMAQIFPTTAEKEYLDHLLEWRGIPRNRAVAAGGKVLVKGVIGKVIPLGSILRGAQEQLYEVVSDTTLTTSPEAVLVRAQEAGVKGNIPSGSLEFIKPISRVESIAIVESNGISGGLDAETDASYRQRGLQAVQTSVNRYGAEGDWVYWAKNSSTLVFKAFETPNFHNTGRLMVHIVGANNSVLADSVVQKVITDTRLIAPLGVLWDVSSPQISKVDISLVIISHEASYRKAIQTLLSEWFEKNSRPGATIQQATLLNVLSLMQPAVQQLQLSQPTMNFDQNVYPVLGQITFSTPTGI